MATNISFPTYGFVNEILALSEDNWRTFFKPFITDSVQSGLATIAGANMTVYVSAGECRCGAVMGILDEMIALDIANGDSTYDRIDSVIVQYTYGEPSTLAVAIVQGTPSANPVPPTLTKVYDTLWQMEIAQILVPSGATSSSEFTITDKRVIYESIESIIDDNTESEERVWSSQKSREEIVSLSTEIYDSLNTKADVITRTASGDIVTITDGGDNLPVKELVVDIDPVQDLHGYDNPWPAGGGKNKFKEQFRQGSSLDLSSTTRIVTQESIYVEQGKTYTFSASNYTNFQYVLNSSQTNVLPITSDYNYCGAGRDWVSTSITFTATNDGYVFPVVRKPDNTSITPSDVTNVHMQLELGSSATSYAPYSNICPISGWDEAVVTRTGKSLLEPKLNITTKNGVTFTENNDGTITTSGAPTENFSGTYPQPFSTGKINTLKPGTYRLSGCPSGGSSSTYKLAVWNQTTASQLAVDYGSGTTFTIPETPHAYYVRITIYKDVDVTGYVWKPMITKVEDDITYEPYQGTEVIIDLDGTRYGGVLDVLTGEMTVTHGYADLGDYTWTYYTSGAHPVFYTGMPGGYTPEKYSSLTEAGVICSIYPNGMYAETRSILARDLPNKSFSWISANTNILIRDDSYSSASDFKTAMSGVQVVYPLKTPLTVQLTPSQISTLLGQNNIWADTGDVAVEYRANSKLFIDEQIAESQIKTRQMMTVVTDQMIAPNNLSTNDIVVVNDELYKATANIASGEEMTVGTNVIKITLAEYIQSLL